MRRSEKSSICKMFLLRCPKCGNQMKYSPSGSLDGKKKRCVYCGRTFTVHSNIEKSTIIRKI